MADPTEPEAAHTEAGEGLTEREADSVFDALDAEHDKARHVHAAECCWPFPGATAAMTAAVEQIIRDRQADAWDEGYKAAWEVVIHQGDRPNPYRTLRGER